MQGLASQLFFAYPYKGFSNKKRKERKCFIYFSVQDIYFSLTCMFPGFEGTPCLFHERFETKFRRFALGFKFINHLQSGIVVAILQVAVELFENRIPLFLIFFLCLLCGGLLKKVWTKFLVYNNYYNNYLP